MTDDYNDDIYIIQTQVRNDLPSGDYDTTIVASLQTSGPFFIADAILTAHILWGSLAYYEADIVQVVLDDVETGTWYNYVDEYIHIRNREPNSDTYDKDVIFHEYGHFIEDIFQFFDQAAGEHDWGEIIFPTMAGTEGFATYISCVFRNDPTRRDFYNAFADTFWVNAENGCLGINSYTTRSANNYGDACEASVCGILWDIYDTVNDDYSTYQWPPLPPPNGYNPDGIGDTLSNGPGNILEVLLHRTLDGNHPDDINEFWEAWFQSPSKGHPKAMRDIWYEHGIIEYLCGDANGDGELNVADAVFLISYIWKEGPAPDPLESGDANSDGSVNVGDVAYIINNIYRNGPPPCA